MQSAYSNEQIWKTIEKLPEELAEALFSVETANAIRQVCAQHAIGDARVGDIAEIAGQVLMGFLLPQEVQEKLEKEIGLQKETAQGITRDLNRLVFYPVKPALEQLHQMEIQVTAKIVTPKPPTEEKQAPQADEKPEEPRGPDSYREPLE